MKRVLVFAIIILIASSGLGLALDRHIPYEIASENDKGIYIYLKSILLHSDIVLKNIIWVSKLCPEAGKETQHDKGGD